MGIKLKRVSAWNAVQWTDWRALKHWRYCVNSWKGSSERFTDIVFFCLTNCCYGFSEYRFLSVVLYHGTNLFLKYFDCAALLLEFHGFRFRGGNYYDEKCLLFLVLPFAECLYFILHFHPHLRFCQSQPFWNSPVWLHYVPLKPWH